MYSSCCSSHLCCTLAHPPQRHLHLLTPCQFTCRCPGAFEVCMEWGCCRRGCIWDRDREAFGAGHCPAASTSPVRLLLPYRTLALHAGIFVGPMQPKQMPRQSRYQRSVGVVRRQRRRQQRKRCAVILWGGAWVQLGKRIRRQGGGAVRIGGGAAHSTRGGCIGMLNNK